MFRSLLGRQDPGYGRQRAVLHILGELFERKGAHAALIEGRIRLGIAEPLEGEAAMHRAGPIVVRVLIDAPVDPGRLQHFGNGRPFQRIAGIGVARLRQCALDPAAQIIGFRMRVPAIHALGRDGGIEAGAGPEDDAIGVGAAGDRTMISVADGEGLGERKLEGNVLPLIIAHRIICLIFGPQAEFALIPGGLRVREAVRRARHLERVGPLRIQMKGRQVARAVGLPPDRAIVGQGDGMAIAKTPHPFERAEIMIEGPVFLHQDDDMLHVLDRAGHALGPDGQRPPDAARHGRHGPRHAGGLEEIASVLQGHGRSDR